MKRRDFIRAAGVGLPAATVLAAPAIAQERPEIRWRMTSHAPRSLDTIFGSADYFAKKLSEITEGRFQIETFAAGEIVGALQGLEAAQNNTVECAQTCSFYFVGRDPAFAFGTSLPFALNTRTLNAWHYGEGMDLLNDFYSGYNIYGLPFGNTGTQTGGWFRREISSVSDLNGLKYRIGGLAGQIMAKLGVVAQQIPGADIYPALERGTIDGAEWIGPYDDERLGLQKVAPYYYYPGWWEGGTTIHLFINLDAWNSLPESYQSALKVAAEAANQWMLVKYDNQNPGALRRLVESGAQLRPFSQEIMTASFEAAVDLYTETAATNENFRTLLESVSAYRDDALAWLQTAEYHYDTFTFRNRRNPLYRKS